ncbi:MAG TPA: pyridoxal-dependent decarboxylase [Planctomycetaceae bacterium]|nr:pyridoxal-dependent decarboxylase [Planctomycetaceae bacterium]
MDLKSAAYSPELFAACGMRLCEWLETYLEEKHARQGRVTPELDPSKMTAAARKWLQTTAPASEQEVHQRWSSMIATMLSHAQNLHHPHYIGHQVPAPVPIAGLCDAVGSVTNQPMAVFEMGPWATAVERALVAALGEQLGFAAGSFAGFITHGGSLANFTALLTARNVALGDTWENGVDASASPVILTQADAHYSIARAAGMLGIGTRNVIKVGLDDRRRMSAAALRTELEYARTTGRKVIAVCASCCTTPIGAFDPLEPIADLCEEFGVWLHVDAAHGGAACFSDQHRPLLNGISRADSVVWDAHKMLFVPALCAFVFYKNAVHRFEAFRQDAPYLFDPSNPGQAEFDVGLQTVECTKRAAGFGLWGVWSLFGSELFRTLVEGTFSLAQQFYEELRASEDFTPLHKPECNIVVFRYQPPTWNDVPLEELGTRQLKLRRALMESGDYYITATKLDGVGAMRVTIINPLTTIEDLRGLLDSIRQFT